MPSLSRRILAEWKHGFQFRRGPATTGSITSREFRHDDVDRPTVANDVMRGENEHVPLGAQSRETGAEQRAGDEVEGRARLFVHQRGETGFTTSDIHKKLALRASITSELHFDEVRLPADAVLPGVTGLKGPLSCLSEARFGIIWGATGAARACYECAVEYARTREQFGRPIGGFQLTQSKLAWMASDLIRAQLLALHLGRLKEAGPLRPDQVSLGKMTCVRTAIDIARQARTILGANGITLEYPVIRHANNLEAVLTYEGTQEIHELAIGEAITGLPAYR